MLNNYLIVMKLLRKLFPLIIVLGIIFFGIFSSYTKKIERMTDINIFQQK